MGLKAKAFMSVTLVNLFVALPVFSQESEQADTENQPDEEEEIENVVVVGVRSSLQKSLDLKRETSAHIDVITAEDVTRFPDVNVAESLSRLPSVTVDRRSGGEGDRVAINGVDSRLINVSLDGTPLATASTGENNSNSGRSFSFSNLAPEIIGNVEVFKTSQARLDEGGVGGSIIVNTRNPLSTPKNQMALSLNVNQNQRNNHTDPRYSLFYNWKNTEETFGALFLYAFNRSVLGSGAVGASYQDVCSANGWGGCDDQGFTNPASLPEVVSGPALAPGMLVPQYLAMSSSEQVRERETFHSVLEWQPNDAWRFKASGLKIDSDFSSYSQVFLADISVPWNEANAYDSRDPQTNEVLSPTLATSVITSDAGVVGGSGAIAVRIDENYRKQALTNNTYNLEAEWTPGPWQIRLRGGSTEAKGGVNPQYYLSFYGNQQGEWTYGPEGSYLELDVPTTDPSIFKTRAVGQQAGFVKTAVTTDTIDYGFLDVTRDLQGPFEQLLFGYKYHKHSNINQPVFYNTVFDLTGSMADFNTFLSDPALVEGLSSAGDLKQYVAMTANAVRDYSENNVSPANATGTFRDAGNFWNTAETANALYIQGNFASGPWSGDIGLRYVETSNGQTYRSVVNNTQPEIEEMVNVRSSYQDLLPSFNLVYNFSEDMLVRFSAGKVMARVTFRDMSGQVAWNIDRYGLNNQNFGGSGGNPELEPYRATNYTATWEWYFSENSIVNIDFLYKDIGSYIVRKTNLVDVVVPNAVLDLCENPSEFCYGKIERVTPMLIDSPFNGSNAQISGLALGFIGDLGGGFGIQANSTWLEQEYGAYTDEFNEAQELPLPYLSDWSYSLAPFYEKGPISARLSYTWRSEYNTRVGSDRDLPAYAEEFGQLDASFTYNWSEDLAFTLSAQNLLDDEVVPFTEGGLPTSWTKYGTRITLGLTYRLQGEN